MPLVEANLETADDRWNSERALERELIIDGVTHFVSTLLHEENF